MSLEKNQKEKWTFEDWCFHGLIFSVIVIFPITAIVLLFYYSALI